MSRHLWGKRILFVSNKSENIPGQTFVASAEETEIFLKEGKYRSYKGIKKFVKEGNVCFYY